MPIPKSDIIYGRNRNVYIGQYVGDTPYVKLEDDDFNPDGWGYELTNYIDLTYDLLEALEAGDYFNVPTDRLRNLISKVNNRNILIDINKLPNPISLEEDVFNTITITEDKINQLNVLQELAGNLSVRINEHNAYEIPKRISDKVFINKLVSNMFNTYHDIATVGYATLATTLEPIEDAASKAPAASDSYSPFVVTSQIKMNENNKVGKQVVGIVASAIKAEYAIEYWINSGHASIIGRDLKWPGLNKDFSTTHNEFFSNFSQVAVLLSSLLSQATDNAKNPILNLINCTSETAPGIIWMIMSGADLNDIVTIFTDPVMNMILSKVKGNFFEDEDSTSISNAIDELIKTEKGSTIGKKLMFFKTVFDGASEITLLAQELSVNQGIPTEFGEVINKRIRFEKGIERIFNRKINQDNIFKTNSTVRKYTKNNRFTFDKNRFFSDDDYANEMINLYQQCATTVNVLDVLRTSPHFFEMDKLSLIAEQALAKISGKYRAIVEQLNRDKVTQDKELTIARNLLINRLRSMTTDDMIVQAIKNMRFKYASNVSLEGSGSVKVTKDINIREINTPLGLKNFVVFVNEVLIPALKKKYPTNFFLNNLIADKKYNLTSKGFVRYYKPMFNILEKTNQDYYEKMLIDFNLIANDSVTSKDLGDVFSNINDDSWPLNKVSDYLFLYNLIVNKNSITGDSLSKLFTEVIKNNKLIKTYFNFIGGEYDSSFNLDSTLSEDYNTLYKKRERRGPDEDFDDFGYDYDAYDDYASSKPQNVFPLNNNRYKQLNKGTSQQLTNERKLNVAYNKAKLIIKHC